MWLNNTVQDRESLQTMKFCSQCGAVHPTDFVTCPRDQTTLSTADDLQPGMIIRDKYSVLEKIGAGGMAAVYRVRRAHFDDIYAFKLVSKSLANATQFVTRFRSDAVM